MRLNPNIHTHLHSAVPQPQENNSTRRRRSLRFTIGHHYAMSCGRLTFLRCGFLITRMLWHWLTHFFAVFFLRLSLAGPIRAVHFPHDPGDVDQGLLLPQVHLGPVAVERVHFLRSVHELLHPELQEETHPRAEHRQRSGKGERRINDDASHRGQEGQLRRRGEFHLTNQDTERLFIISWIQLLCIDEYEYRNVRFRLGVDIWMQFLMTQHLVRILYKDSARPARKTYHQVAYGDGESPPSEIDSSVVRVCK